MSQHWLIDVNPLKSLWKVKTSDVTCSAREKMCQLCARDVGTLKDFLSKNKVPDMAVQASELFLEVAIKIQKRSCRILQCLFGGAWQADLGCPSLSEFTK